MTGLLRYINIIIGIFIVLVFLLVVKAINNDYRKKYSALEKKLADMEKKGEYVAKLPHLDKQIKNLRDKIFKGNIINFKNIVEKEALARNIDIDSFTPREKETYGGYRKVEFVLQLNSDYNSFKEFVCSLESLGCVEVKTIRRSREGNNYYLDMIAFLEE